PAGLQDKPRGGPTGSRLPEVTKRTILMLKQDNPDWGCERISAMLLRGPTLPACPQAVARVLHEAGYELEETPTRPATLPRSGCVCLTLKGFIIMPQSLCKMFAHIVFSTKERFPFLAEATLRDELHRYMAEISRRLGCPAVRVGGAEDHIHLLALQARTL